MDFAISTRSSVLFATCRTDIPTKDYRDFLQLIVANSGTVCENSPISLIPDCSLIITYIHAPIRTILLKR